MIRRSLLGTGALVVLVTLTSCSSVSRNNDAARVGDHVLRVDQIGALMNNGEAVQDASQVRASMTKWIRVELLEQATGTSNPAVASTANLDARLADGLTVLANETPDAGRELYAQGPATSGTVCLGAIPVADDATAAQALDELNGGMSWADAATKYSTDAGLAGNGGVVMNGNGDECFGTGDINPDIMAPIEAAGVGVPAVVPLGGVNAIVIVRPYDELSDDAKGQLARSAMNTTRLPQLLAEADVYIDPRYGTWNSATAEVDPLRA